MCHNCYIVSKRRFYRRPIVQSIQGVGIGIGAAIEWCLDSRDRRHGPGLRPGLGPFSSTQVTAVVPFTILLLARAGPSPRPGRSLSPGPSLSLSRKTCPPSAIRVAIGAAIRDHSQSTQFRSGAWPVDADTDCDCDSDTDSDSGRKTSFEMARFVPNQSRLRITSSGSPYRVMRTFSDS